MERKDFKKNKSENLKKKNIPDEDLKTLHGGSRSAELRKRTYGTQEQSTMREDDER